MPLWPDDGSRMIREDHVRFCEGPGVQSPRSTHPYVPTSEGWLYLAVVLDLFTRKIVGWAMRDHMRAEFTIAALTMAIQRQKPPPGLIHHSDRGSQYAAADYRKALCAAGMIQSMSRKGNCWDCESVGALGGPHLTDIGASMHRWKVASAL
jgi:transposase InsO family protein